MDCERKKGTKLPQSLCLSVELWKVLLYLVRKLPRRMCTLGIAPLHDIEESMVDPQEMSLNCSLQAICDPHCSSAKPNTLTCLPILLTLTVEPRKQADESPYPPVFHKLTGFVYRQTCQCDDILYVQSSSRWRYITVLGHRSATKIIVASCSRCSISSLTAIAEDPVQVVIHIEDWSVFMV